MVHGGNDWVPSPVCWYSWMFTCSSASPFFSPSSGSPSLAFIALGGYCDFLADGSNGPLALSPILGSSNDFLYIRRLIRDVLFRGQRWNRLGQEYIPPGGMHSSGCTQYTSDIDITVSSAGISGEEGIQGGWRCMFFTSHSVNSSAEIIRYRRSVLKSQLSGFMVHSRSYVMKEFHPWLDVIKLIWVNRAFQDEVFVNKWIIPWYGI